MKRMRLLLVLDVILFVSLIVLSEPRFEGLALHEWIGLAIIPPVIVHILFGWRWIITTMARLFRESAWRLRVNAALNLFLFVAFVVTIFSGAMTSFIALPALGIPAHNFESWRVLHKQWEVYLEISVALHLAMNWNWVASAVGGLIWTRRNEGSADHKAASTARTI
jgi:hypothetical protein